MRKSIKIYKSGKFYNAFGDDGYILHELLGYKYVDYKNCVGFPESAYSKVKSLLEEFKISFIVYEKDKLIYEFKGLDKNYNIILKKALSGIKIEKRIERLKERINSCSEKELENIYEAIENGLFK